METQKRKKFIALKIKNSKLKNAEKLCEQLNRVMPFLSERYRMTENPELDMGTAGDDVLMDKTTLRIRWTV